MNGHTAQPGMWQPRLLPTVLRARAKESSADIALRFLEDGNRETVAWSYGEFFGRVRAVGATLRQQAQAGDRVLLIYPPGLDFVVAFCACLITGLVAVPCSPPGARSRATGRLAAIALDARAALLATTEGIATGLQADASLGEAWTCVTTDNIAAAQGCADSWPDEPRAEDLAFLQYTSGSTARPKGVMVTQGQLAANLEALRLTFALTREDVCVTWLPSFHDMGLVDGVLEPLYAGCLGVVIPPAAFLMNPRCWLQAISTYGGTHGGGPSFGYDLLLQRMTPADWGALDLSRWRTAYNGAEPIRAEVIERFAQAAAAAGFRPEAMVPCYGLAEATLMVTSSSGVQRPTIVWVEAAALEQDRVVPTPADAAGSRPLVGCGTPERGTEVVIAAPLTSTALPPGSIGEVWVRGPAIAHGYWDQPALTDETFNARLDDGRGPYLRTGDLGTLIDSELFITGRIKDLIILQGRNHYPQDIEACAEASHAALRSANSAAFSVPGPHGEELVLVMEAERRARRSLDVEEVAAAVRAAVADGHAAVVECVTLIPPGSLPKTSSGKIQRRGCRQAWLDGQLKLIGQSTRRAQNASSAPRTPTERHAESELSSMVDRLVGLASEVLSVRPSLIDPRQPLNRAGLDSLRAIRLAGEIGRMLGREVSPTLLYDHPSLLDLAQALIPQGKPQAHTPVQSRLQEPVAVVGLGCRVPGARGRQALWDLLRQGSEALVQAAGHRWPSAAMQARGLQDLRAGLVDGLDGVDTALFGLSPTEAQILDPQQRLLLETSWEALEDAQLAPSRLATKPVGVFVGISSQDWGRVTAPLGGPATLLSSTGSALSIAANRLSYFYDFQGPSVAVDTACSSSLMALHLACRSLEEGECQAALVGGVNALLDLSTSEAFARAGMLSRAGRCATFDRSADGYVRAEGCVVLVLKTLAQAQADGDRILAVVRGTATNQDGRSQGLTAPNGLAQQAVVRAALQRAGAQPHDVVHVEAHGTGTPLGDPIEAQALAQVFGPGRPPDHRLWVSSVKTNVGHLEAAAGLLGVAKSVLCLHHRQLVAHLHLQEPNPLVPMGVGHVLEVPRAARAWPEGLRAWAGVSSFGFGGTNVHAVLGPPAQTAPAPGPSLAEQPDAGRRIPLMLSAASPQALSLLARRWADHLESASASGKAQAWTHACGVAARGRAVLPYRMALWSTDEGVPQTLEPLRAGPNAAGGLQAAAGRPQVAWMFTGQGSVWGGMGTALMDEPAFIAGLAEVAPLLQPALPQPIHQLLTQTPTEQLTPSAVAQPLLFAFGWALARWWHAQGAAPAVVMGHSLGEITAAAVGGLITLESAAAFVIARGRIMSELSGRMVAVAAGSTRVVSLFKGDASIRGWGLAGDNAPTETVLSGPLEGLEAVVQRLRDHGIPCRVLDTPHAFHSEALVALEGPLRAAASRLQFRPPRVPVVPAGPTAQMDSVEYWVAQAREPVRFRTAIAQARSLGIEGWLELGPRPVLCGLVEQTLQVDAAESAAPHWLAASMRPSATASRAHEQALCSLWVQGALPSDSLAARVPQLGPVAAPEDAPLYPFDRRRYWPAGLEDVVLTSREEAVGGPEKAPFVRIRMRPATVPSMGSSTGLACVLVGHPGSRRFQLAAALQGAGLLTRAVGLPSPAEASRDLEQALLEVTALPATQAVSVVLMLDGSDKGTAGDVGLPESVQRAYSAALSTVQALLQHGHTAVTRTTAQSRLHLTVVADGLPPAAAQAAAAVLRVWALENPAGAGAFVELATGFEAAAELVPLCLPHGSRSHGEWCWNAQGWTVREHTVLSRVAPDRPSGTDAIHGGLQEWAGAGVLVAGGLGGIGRHLVRALAKRGVARLWLVGRRTPGHEDLQAWQEELATDGVHLEAWSIDLEKPEGLQQIHERLSTSPVPLSHVIYAAGRTADAPLAQQSLAAFDDLCRIQFLGPIRLFAALDAQPWRRFILCGSAAGLVGSAAQAPYAAAHAALAAWAQAQDRPQRRLMTIAWGPWRDTGLAASPRIQQALQSQGVALLDPEDACDGLFEMVEQGWDLAGLFHPRNTPPYQSGQAAAAPGFSAEDAPAGHPEPTARLQWLQASPASRRERALALVQQDAASLLGHPSGYRLEPHRGFFEIGFDSLSLVALRQRLQTRWGMHLPTTVAFEQPCLADLAGHLHESMISGLQQTASESHAGVNTDPAAPAATAPVGSPTGSADALTRELEAIEKLLG